jgi:hypothetical protein
MSAEIENSILLTLEPDPDNAGVGILITYLPADMFFYCLKSKEKSLIIYRFSLP